MGTGRDLRYEHILAEVLGTPWAITPPYLAIISEIVARRAAGTALTEEELEARLAAAQERPATRPSGVQIGTVAVMPLVGALLPRGEAMKQMSGATSVQHLTKMFDRLVADESISAIVLDFDSPGGSVGGIAEFADRVFASRAVKPVVAIANPVMASAAYWIGAAATELLVTPTAQTGSIGVFTAHADVSKALEQEGVTITLVSAGAKKTLGNPFEPLSEDARAELQKHVDAFYGMFVKGVARGRGQPASKVRGGFGQGGVVGAAEAVELGMADAVGTIDDAIGRAAARAQQRAVGGAAGARALAPTRAEQRDPNDDGTCPEGYHKTDDGMCEPDAQADIQPAAYAAEAKALRELLAARGA